MARLADGDRAAFRPLFDRLWPAIQRLCRKLIPNEADAADAGQNAMVKIFERVSAYDRARPAMPWALAIAAWECRTIARRRARQREVGEDSIDDRALAVEEDFVRHDLVQAALHAIGGMSDPDREALLATFWDQAASVSGPTLRKRRERALTRLREALRRLYGLD